MPDQCSQPTDYQFNPNAREDDPLTRSPRLEQKDVRSVGEKCGSEINEQKAHLMNLTAKMFASEPVTKFMYATQTQKQYPKDPDVVGAFTRETIQGRSILLHPRPIAGKQVNRDGKYEQREDDETLGKQPSEIFIQFC